MNIKDIPWYDRPGARLTRGGVEKLTNADLLAVLLGKGKEESVLELSNRLLKKYNLNKLEELGLEELTKECKGDKVPALKVLSFIELSKRYNKLIKGGYNSKPITSAKDVYDMFVDEFGKKKKEYFICLYLDTRNRIIKEEVISVGTLNSSLIHPREVFKTAIKESANSIILIHNHPSGDVEPSEGDEEVTKRLIEAGDVLNIKVLDHIIIGKNSWKSI